MILYEYEGKALLERAGIKVPQASLFHTRAVGAVNQPVILKAQVLTGKRAEAGGIIKVLESGHWSNRLAGLSKWTVRGERVKNVLVEELIEFDRSYYLSLTYDSGFRGPVLMWSETGGAGVEDGRVEVVPISADSTLLPATASLPRDLLQSLVNLFFQNDCLLLEINPLVYGCGRDGRQDWYALDAKVKLDDYAASRHPEWSFPPRSEIGRPPTPREVAAKQIDSGNHRGTAGSSYVDLEGDIAVLASGGGASLVAMDALVAAGGEPANYTEYSGNPPREKVEKLAKIVLGKPGLHGLWVVGAMANFTDIFETMSAIVNGLRSVRLATGKRLDFPIVVRRGGPHDQEAFAMLKLVTDFDFHLHGPEVSIVESAKIIVKLASQFARRNRV